MIVMLLIAVAIIAAIVAVLLASQSGGPRVTTIEHTTEHKKDGDDA